MSLKRIATLLLTLLATGSVSLHAGTNRVLMIDPSSMPVVAGKATLIIGALRGADGIYTGDYKLKVSPYFFKNEKGRLAILISDETLASAAAGKVVSIIGTATTNGKGGKSRHIDATATPIDLDRGKLKLWFTADGRKMIFEPTYHFAEINRSAASVSNSQSHPASKSITRPLPVSPRETVEAAVQFP